ncbi:hypothetical protein THAOC_19301, partial [Thalassiosira oceanica]
EDGTPTVQISTPKSRDGGDGPGGMFVHGGCPIIMYVDGVAGRPPGDRIRGRRRRPRQQRHVRVLPRRPRLGSGGLPRGRDAGGPPGVAGRRAGRRLVRPRRHAPAGPRGPVRAARGDGVQLLRGELTGGLGTGTSRYLRTGPGRASRARTGLNDLAMGRKVASRDPLVALHGRLSIAEIQMSTVARPLPPADGAARPSDSLCRRRTASRPLNTPPVDRTCPKTDAASAPGGPREEEDTRRGRSVVPSDPRRSSFASPAPPAPRGGGTLAVLPS